MEGEDFFGDVAVPLDEEEEDAANDLTFGDTSDIRAGDDSDAAWNPNHLTLSSKIEAEKEALQRKRLLGHPVDLNGHSPAAEAHQMFKEAHGEHDSLYAAKESGVSPWELLQRSVQEAQATPVQPPPPRSGHQPVTVIDQPRLPQSLLQPLQSANQQSLQQIPQHAMTHRLQQAIPQPAQQATQRVHQQQPFGSQYEQFPPSQHSSEQLRGQLSPHELHQLLVSYQQQQTSLLLRQHQETAEKQLLEAERAQQAGVSFDRAKFDRHQEATRQMILSDHYARLRQVQFQVFQYQQSQQFAERKAGGLVDPLQSRDPQKANGSALQGLDSYEPSTQRPPIAHSNAESSPNGSHFKDMRIQLAAPELHRDHNKHFRSSTGLGKLRDEDIENAPRMLEIERQMAEAGLGPRAVKSDPGKDALELHSERNNNNGLHCKEKKTKRRLESMTDRDQELVFRAHLRQIETAEVYKDDYYNSILRAKEKLGDHEIFSSLADRVQSLRLRGKEKVTTRPIRVKSARRSSSGASGDDRYTGSSPLHSDQNMRALANALGTVQSWNPRAPRRVMDFSLLEKKDSNEEKAPQKSLREDERVHVRQEVERGYDIIACIHDIVRGENQNEPLGRTIQSLMSTLHLAEKRSEDTENQETKHHSTRFFATMCVIPKGRRYLALILELLDVPERIRVISAIYENLGMVVFASRKAKEREPHETPCQSDLFSVMTKIVAGPDIAFHDYLHILESFISSHFSHRDAFLTTFRSAVGSQLIFLCTQRISKGLAEHVLSEEDLADAKIERLSEAFTHSLQDIFEGAESVNRVWEVSASLDTLATAENKEAFRAELSRLLKSGAIPRPRGR